MDSLYRELKKKKSSSKHFPTSMEEKNLCSVFVLNHSAEEENFGYENICGPSLCPVLTFG